MRLLVTEFDGHHVTLRNEQYVKVQILTKKDAQLGFLGTGVFESLCLQQMCLCLKSV